MGVQVVMGATLQCSFGVAPSSLVVLPTNKVMAHDAGGQHHGQQADAEHPALRHVHVARQPHGGRGDGGGPGSAHAHAVHPRHGRSLGARLPTVLIGNMPALENNSQADVQLGRRHPGDQPRPVHGAGWLSPRGAFLLLDGHLLDKLLEAEAPDLESSDERLEKVNGLVARSAYVEAARTAEALLREGLRDVRLVGPYLLGLFLERGLDAMPVVFRSLSSTLLRELAVLRPARAQGRLRRHRPALAAQGAEQAPGAPRAPQGRDVAALARAQQPRASGGGARRSARQIFSALGRRCPGTACEAPFRRLTQWLEGHVQRCPLRRPSSSRSRARDGGRARGGVEPEADEAAPEPSPRRAPRTRRRSRGPACPSLPRLAQLMRKLAAFDTLVEREDFQAASVVAADVLSLVERFDPRVYLPLLFSRFFAGLSTHAETLEPLLQGTDSLSVPRARSALPGGPGHLPRSQGSDAAEQEELGGHGRALSSSASASASAASTSRRCSTCWPPLATATPSSSSAATAPPCTSPTWCTTSSSATSPAKRVIITVNVGLLSVQSPLPSFMMQTMDQLDH